MENIDISYIVHHRQRQLEEALLCSGQFKDALQALIDWLYKVEPLLAEDQPLHGDLDTVNSLLEEHKVDTYIFYKFFINRMYMYL